MKCLWWLTLFLIACTGAPEPRREFRDGPMVRPPPVFVAPGHTPAGAGLPEYMRPPEPAPQRGTDARVLPPTKEPGIWASDSPHVGPAPTSIGGVMFPPPEVPDAVLTPVCLSEPDRLLNKDKTRALFDRLTEPFRRCVAANLYRQCVDIIEEDLAHTRAANRRMYKLPVEPPEIPKSVKDAKRIHTALCKGIPPNPASHDIERAVIDELAHDVGSGR